MSEKRTTIGVLTLMCLLAAAGLWLFSEKPDTHQLLLGALTRVGVVLGSLWLALPRKGESIVWEKAAPILVAAVILVAVTRRAFIYILPVAVVVALALIFLRPRPKRPRTR